MYKFLIAGGGAASMAVSRQLLRTGVAVPSDICVIESSDTHYCQPGFTMLGGGLLGPASEFLKWHINSVKRETRPLFDSRIHYVQDSIKSFHPENNSVTMESKEIKYEHLIIAIGITMKFEQVQGLKEALEDTTHPVGSVYLYEYAMKTNHLIREFSGGKAVFCQPNTPFKCEGAPQNIMYLAESAWKKSGVRDKTNIDFYLPQQTLFVAPQFSAALNVVAKDKGIKVNHGHLLTKVHKEDRKATFRGPSGDITVDYDFLHVCPPQGVPDCLLGSELLNEGDYVNVNKRTLQHEKYDNIWALGDAAGLPTAKTATAAFTQAPILVSNLSRTLKGRNLNDLYTGYTACPLFVGGEKLMFAEFNYKLESGGTFLPNQEVPSRLSYHLTKRGIPIVYWNLVPRGLWYGKHGLLRPKLPF